MYFAQFRNEEIALAKHQDGMAHIQNHIDATDTDNIL